VTWAIGWAHYCNGDLDAAERLLVETTVLAPPADQWIVGVAALADLSLIAGLRGRRAEQMRLATEAPLRREREVLRMLSSGLSEREIGLELYVSFNTVHSHVKSVYRKLGVSSRADAVARARDDRLL